MKQKTLITLVAVVFLGTLLAGSAQAGWFDKKDNDGDQTKAHRFDAHPPMSFHMGTLRRDTYSGWSLNERALQFISGARVTERGVEVTTLNEGDQVMVMGAKVGETILVWRVRVLDPDENLSQDDSSDSQVIWSTSDPTVGEATGGE